MLHRARLEWPCLSFAVVPDALGEDRAAFPHTAYFVAGTQAEARGQNRLLCLKMSAMHRTKHDDESGAQTHDTSLRAPHAVADTPSQTLATRSEALARRLRRTLEPRVENLPTAWSLPAREFPGNAMPSPALARPRQSSPALPPPPAPPSPPNPPPRPADPESDDEEGADEDALLECQTIAHPGCVNRLKLMPQAPRSRLACRLSPPCNLSPPCRPSPPSLPPPPSLPSPPSSLLPPPSPLLLACLAKASMRRLHTPVDVACPQP